jgi:hypothetical protein
LAIYDAVGKRAIFIPWGGGMDDPLGVLLGYHTNQDFFAVESYEAIDLTSLIDPAAEGFAGAFIDDAGTWLYLVPFRKDIGSGIEPNGLAIRFNLGGELSDPSAYEAFDVTTLPSPPPRIGWATGAFIDGFAYYLPVVEAHDTYIPHGYLLRYDTTKAFDDPIAWEWYNLVENVHHSAWGFQSNAVKYPWLYLIPFGVGNSVIVRYDVSRPFNDSDSYEAFDIATLNTEAKGFTGGVVVGDYLVLIPWRDRSRPPLEQSMSVAALYYTRKPLSDPDAWSFFDLTLIHPEARGYMFGWLDLEGFVHFVPAANFATRVAPPFVIWDSNRPFTEADSWTSYPSTGVPTSTGAAFDGLYAWLAPFGTDISGNSGLITRVSTWMEGSTPTK